MNHNLTFSKIKLQLEALKEHLTSYFLENNLLDQDNIIETLSFKWHMNANFLVGTDVHDSIKALHIYYNNTPPLLYTTHVWVNKNYRGNGICQQMFSLAEKESIPIGCKYHKLEVLINNTIAIKAYTKMKFHMADKNDEKYLLTKDLI